jgi:glycosyltransferase 2 family protein
LHDRTQAQEAEVSNLTEVRRTRGIVQRGIQWSLAIVVFGFLFFAVKHSLDQLQSTPEILAWNRVRWLPLTVGFLLSGAALFPAGIAWLQTLRDFRLDVPIRHGAYAYFLGHLGKYVPGKAMAILLRVGYLHRLGVLVRPAILSVFIETMTSLTTGSILGALLLQGMDAPAWLKWCALACIPLAAATLIPDTFRWLVARISRSRLGKMPEFVAQAIRWKLMLRCAAWSLLGWLLHGTAGWLLLMAIAPEPELLSLNAWCTCVASMCLAALAGFISMIPGGAGVRELVATWGIATLVSTPVALVAAVVTRLAVISAELLILGCMALWVHWNPKAPMSDGKVHEPGI